MAQLWSLLVGVVLTIAGRDDRVRAAPTRLEPRVASRGGARYRDHGLHQAGLLSFALVLAIGFLLMVSLVISAVLATLHAYLDARFEGAAVFLQALDLAISFGVAAVLIALMFKYLPDRKIEWRDTWLGAVVTAALFIVGKQVIGLYLGQTTVASSFGAAGSVVVFMIWVYYAGLILLFGAEITQAVAARRGAIVLPTENAKPAPAAATKG